jgi:hypothetical protein
VLRTEFGILYRKLDEEKGKGIRQKWTFALLQRGLAKLEKENAKIRELRK